MRSTSHLPGHRAGSLLVLAVLALAACSDANPTDFDLPDAGIDDFWPVGEISRVTLHGPGELFIEQGPEAKLRVSEGRNQLPRNFVLESGGELALFAPGISGTDSDVLQFHVTVPDLESVALEGDGRIQVRGFRAASFGVLLAGEGRIDLVDMRAGTLRVLNTGEGTVRASGIAAEQIIELAFEGGYEGARMDSERTAVTVGGRGSATVCVHEELDVVITSAGSVYYLGDPAITSHITGTGNVLKIGA